MPIKVTCPKCQGVLHAPDDAGGKRGKCPTCGTVLAIPADAAHSAPSQPAERHLPEPAHHAPPRASTPDLADALPHRPPASVANEARRSSVGGIGGRPEPAVRASVAPGTRPAAALDDRKPRDPFAKAARTAGGPPPDKLVRAYRKTRRGLGLIQFSLFLCLLAAVALPAVEIAKHFQVQLPDQSPGYLGLAGLSAADEIRAAAVLVPFALGLLFLTLGRFGAANAPRTSYSRGPVVLAAVATLIVFLGASTFVAIGATLVAGGTSPLGTDHGLAQRLKAGTGGVVDATQVPIPLMLHKDEASGMAQRAGLAAVLAFVPLAEVWFVTFIGRLGAGLHSRRAVGRHTRFVFLAGLLSTAGLLALVGTAVDPEASRDVWGAAQAHLSKLLADLGEYQYVARNGVAIAAAVVVWFWYARLVGGGRVAVREWLDANAPA